MRFFLVSILSILIMLNENSSWASNSPLEYNSIFKCDGSERFNWYCDEEKKKKVKKKSYQEKKPKLAEEQKQSLPLTEEERALQKFEEMKKTLEKKKKIAIADPTEENIKAYIAYQNFIMDRASIFTDKWQRIIWQNPDLDYNSRFPIASIAKRTQLENIKQKRNENLQKLKSEGYGIFFFYKHDCPYCKAMAAPLFYFHRMTGMDVLPITIDGIKDEQNFPGSVIDHGQAQALHVTQTPSIFLVNTKTRKIIPIAYNWISLEELQKRIYVLTDTKPGDNY